MRRFTLLITFLSLLLCPDLAAQQDSTAVDSAATLSFIANWEVGDSFRYAVTEINVRYIGDSTAQNDTLRYEADFVVVDSTAEGYVVAWESDKEYGDMAMDFLSGVDADFFTMLEDIGDIRPLFRTNEFGAYQGVANVEEMQQVLRLIFPPMVDYLLESGELEVELDSAQEVEFRSLMDVEIEKYLQPASMEKEFLKIVPYMLSPLGNYYYLEDTISSQVNMPSTMPGQTVLQNVVTYLDEHQPEFEYIRLKVLSLMDKESGLSIIGQRLRDRSVPEENISSLLEGADYVERQDNDFYYYYGVGLPGYVDCFKEFTLQLKGELPSTTYEHYIIELIGPFADDE